VSASTAPAPRTATRRFRAELAKIGGGRGSTLPWVRRSGAPLPRETSQLLKLPQNRNLAHRFQGRPSGQFVDLRRRIILTYRYHGLRSLLLRAITFPLRFTPMRRFVDYGPQPGGPESWGAENWYRMHGKAVTIVIPSYRDAGRLSALVKSIRRTTSSNRVDIVVADDASGPEHLAAIRRIPDIRIIEGEVNAGFAANVNRAIRLADSGRDVVLLNSDMIARRGWLASLQFAATRADDIGIVGAKLRYPDGLIQSASTVRHLEAPEWFDHRYRFKPSRWGPANVTQPALAVTGACMYIKRAVLDCVGLLDEKYPMAYEDVDYCLRAWEQGYRVIYWPRAELDHLESTTRGTAVRERERTSQRLFWRRWGDFFDARPVRNAGGALKVIYVTEDTGVGGGHRDIFEHLNGLLSRGHEAELWSLAGEPAWFPLKAPVRTFANYDELVRALAPISAIKVATWWNTASAVWAASVLNGIPVYFVQDIETSYYPHDEAMRNAVLASYRHEFRYMTISSWNRDRLRELGLEATLIPPGIDLETFRPLPDVERRPDMLLALGRSNPLKNLRLTLDAWHALPEPRPELCLFGIEPELANVPGIRYVTAPSDEDVNRLFNQATAFVQTSVHEGFCLPPLESMATGGAVVCTDAHGNRDFCVNGENCLIPEPNRRSVADALGWVLGDAVLRARLGLCGLTTAQDYAWSRRIDVLEQFLTDISTPRRITLGIEPVPAPDLRRA
jgi:GT2 family glycosyltransferase